MAFEKREEKGNDPEVYLYCDREGGDTNFLPGHC